MSLSRIATMPLAAPALIAMLALLSPLPGIAAEPAAKLPPEIERLLDIEPLPPLVVAPTARHALLVHERQLLPLEQLAQPSVELAGRRIDLLTGGAHAPIAYYGLTLVDLDTLQRRALSLPPDATVGYPKWSPDGSRFVFTVTRRSGTELWVGEAASGLARVVARSVDTARGTPCSWLPDNRRLLCRFATERDGGRRTLESVFDSMATQALPGEPWALSNDQAKRLLETQLAIVDSVTSARRPIGTPAAFESVAAAPAQAYLLVTRLAKPYPTIAGIDRGQRVTEIWDRFGRVVARVPEAARAIDWHASLAAVLTWVERQDGVDRIMRWPAPFSTPPEPRFTVPNRFAGLTWLDDGDRAIVTDYDAVRRHNDFWHVDFGDSDSQPRLVASEPSDASARLVTRANPWGLATAVTHADSFYLIGTEATAGQAREFLDRVALRTGARERLWQADGPHKESIVDIAGTDGAVLLTRRETTHTAPNYFLRASSREVALPLTHFETPASSLSDARRIVLEYERRDGVKLGASLYLPPEYRGNTRLPLVVWAYPRQVSAGESATWSVASDSAMTFTRAFRLFFLLHGYAVLDNVSMPIVGDRNTANDTFVEQVAANAAAAIDAAAATGYVDASRVGVAGHSYGAFMVANLLAHSRLFDAGIALSGAYNRTLTPFGFQTERRTLWQARSTYLTMSPLLYSDQIEAPLLLVHGLKDANAGTSPQQSLQLHNAIRGNGGESELLLLPFEGHTYRGRESVRQTASQMLRWFDEHLKGDDTPIGISVSSAR